MTAGRKSLVAKQTEQDEPIVLEQEFSSAMDNMRREGQSLTLAESQRQATVRVVALRVGYQLPGDCADPGLIQRDVASNMRRTAEAMLQVGLGLICLKEACQHGEFLARLEVLRFEPRAAQKYMQVASRLSNAPSTARLLKVVESQTKLLELIVLDDEQLEELELTGQTGELKLDDVATMSVKELRAKVRELKGDVAAKEEVLSRRAKQVDDLEEKLARVKTVPADEVKAELQREATAHLNDTRGALVGKFSAAIQAMYEHADTSGVEPDVAFMAGLVGQLQADLGALRDRFGIPDIAPALIPEWVGDPAFEALAG